MRTRLIARIPDLTLAALLALVVTGVAVEASAHDRNIGSIEGTWINDVKIVTCPPAPHVVIAAFQSMTTYMRGGISIEGGGPAGPPPAVSRSAGHGIWERTGHRAFRTQFRAHSFDNQGRLVRITEVTSLPRLIHGDNPETPDVVEPYYLSGVGNNRITNINPDTGEATELPPGCNEASSRPVLFED